MITDKFQEWVETQIRFKQKRHKFLVFRWLKQQNTTELCLLEAILRIYKDSRQEALNPDMPADELRLHLGELTENEVHVARAAIRWVNRVKGGLK